MDDARRDPRSRTPVPRRTLLAALAGWAGITMTADPGHSVDAARGGCKRRGKHCTRSTQCCGGLRCGRRGVCEPELDSGICAAPQDICQPPTAFCDASRACVCVTAGTGETVCVSTAVGGPGDGQCLRCATASDCAAVLGSGPAWVCAAAACCRGTPSGNLGTVCLVRCPAGGSSAGA
jgi:hypothetical protein